VTETAIPAAATATEGGPCPHGSDDDGFPAFYARWHPQLQRWALQHHGEANAEEIAQETLCRAFVHYRNLRQEVPWPWLRTVAQHVACDLYRRTARIEDGHLMDAAPDVIDPRPGPEELMLTAEVTAHVRAALSSLRQRDRELLTMSVDHDMSVEDIASALGTRSATVRVQLHRARKRLGSVYLNRVGTLVVLPVTACGWVLRQVRRATQPAVPVVAPTALSLAAVVATVGVVGVTWPAGSDGAPVQGTSSMIRVAESASGAVAADRDGAAAVQRAGVITGAAHGGRTSPSDVDLGASPDGAPVAVGAKADVADDPTASGRLHDGDILVQTGLITIRVSGHGDRDGSGGAMCHFAGIIC
jgi:RNA polymerase sigma-70 factor, ECF subfamily